MRQITIGEAGYRGPGAGPSRFLPRFSTNEQALLWMAGLPLLDGVFVSALAGGILGHPLAAFGFGCSVFSGSGCLTTAVTLDGSVRQRVTSVLRVYMLAILPGVLFTLLTYRWLRPLFLPDFPLFSALILGGLALQLWGVPLAADARPSPTPDDVLPARPDPSEWRRDFSMIAKPRVVLAVAVAISLLYCIRHGGYHPASSQAVNAPMALLALLAGGLETLGGAILGALLNRFLNPLWLRRSGAIALVAIALMILGAPIPSAVPLVVLIVGATLGAMRRNHR